MKKILITLIILTACLFLSAQSWAAWTAGTERIQQRGGLTLVSVTLTSDGSAGSYAISTYATKIKTNLIWAVKISPGTGGVAPDNTFDLDVEDVDGFHLIDTDANTHLADSMVNSTVTLGFLPPIENTITFQLADIGTAGDQVTIDLWVVEVAK